MCEKLYAIDDLSNRSCASSKTEDVNLKIFNMIRGIHGSKLLLKNISYDCRCKLDCKICNSKQKLNKGKC